MGWLDAHESYVMEIVARDRVNGLRSTLEVATVHIERTDEPAAVVPDGRPRGSAGVAASPFALAKAAR